MRKKSPRPVVVDFETFGIEGRPHYPPCPVGVSIKYPGRKARYYAFGHVEKNNCSWGEARDAVGEAYRCPDGVLFQNAKFDIDVAEIWFGLAPPPWQQIHDTMFLLFLDDPHQPDLGLKPAAERLLGWDPEEQEAVGEWLVKHQPVNGVKITLSPRGEHYFMRYLPFAPGDLVGEYADGDVERTESIFRTLWEDVCIKREMMEAYDRERQLMPILLEIERQGLPVDLTRLRRDTKIYTEALDQVTRFIIRRLSGPDDLNLNSGEQLVEAMVEAGVVDLKNLPLTSTGKYQTNKEALLRAVTDTELLGVLKYRAQLKTCLGTFMRPWLEVAEKSNGFIYTTWNQVRQPKGGDTGGARTGRLSSHPNFQNMPNTFDPIFKKDTKDPKKKKELPPCPIKSLPPLPKMRSYIIPFKGEVLIDRDYSQQEPRILAHFDGGALMDKYLEDPWTDFHDFAKAELEKMGVYYERRPVKDTNLGLIYGMGVGKLASKTGLPVDETANLKKLVMSLYPGLKEMYQDMRYRAANNEPIRTWGGREYYCEPPKIVAGRLRQFDYKMVNQLIQGSAADCTKEAIIRFWNRCRELGKLGTWKLLLNTHDQLTSSVPKKEVKQAMEEKRLCMESIEFDVPMLTEGKISSTNWEELKEYDKKGTRV